MNNISKIIILLLISIPYSQKIDLTGTTWTYTTDNLPMYKSLIYTFHDGTATYGYDKGITLFRKTTNLGTLDWHVENEDVLYINGKSTGKIDYKSNKIETDTGIM